MIRNRIEVVLGYRPDIIAILLIVMKLSPPQILTQALFLI